jgi:hypothetical protein
MESVDELISRLEGALSAARKLRAQAQQTTTRPQEPPGRNLEGGADGGAFGPIAALDDIPIGARCYIITTSRGTYVSLHPNLEAWPLQAASIWDDQSGYRPTLDSYKYHYPGTNNEV